MSYGCTYPPDRFIPEDSTERLTYNPATHKLYLHLFNYPGDGKYVLPNYNGKIVYAQFLNDDSEIKFKISENGKDIILLLPHQKPSYVVPVIELNAK